jgi:hypothetical protein
MQQQSAVLADILHPAFYCGIVRHTHAHHFIPVRMQPVPLFSKCNESLR